MQHYSRPFVIDSLLRSLSRLEKFSQIPVFVSAETEIFVHSLLPLCDTADKPLFGFVMRLPHGVLENELLKTVVPSRHLQRLLTLCGEHERLAVEKENAIANREFKLGAEYRDAQYEIIAVITEMVPAPINVAPSHLIAALKSLGFDDDLIIGGADGESLDSGSR